jgi:hypothetical protein
MKNYFRLKKSYSNDIILCNEYFAELIDEMQSREDTGRNHYWETINKGIIALSKKLEFYNDICSTKYFFDHINLFVCRPHRIGGLHIDSAANPRFCSLNIPLLDNDTSRMIWVDPTQYSVDKVDVKHGGVRAGLPSEGDIDIDTWNIIDQVDFNIPMLIKVNEWHSVDNRTNPNPRIAVACRFLMNPTFDQMSEELYKKGLI